MLFEKWTWKKNQHEANGRLSGKVWCLSVPVGSTSKERKSERTDWWRGRSRKRGRGWIYIASRSGETDRKSDTERDSAGIIITRGLGVGRSVYSNQRRKKREREREIAQERQCRRNVSDVATNYVAKTVSTVWEPRWPNLLRNDANSK